MAPVVLGLFLLGSVQLFFMGLIGEYVGAIHTQVQKRPLVVENERINFEFGPGEPLGPESLDVAAAARPMLSIHPESAC
jgi:hypothetical protein